MTAETINLLIVVFFVCAAGVYVLRRSPQPAEARLSDPMATKIAALTKENEDLRQQVQRLECTLDTLLEENKKLRERIAKLEQTIGKITS